MLFQFREFGFQPFRLALGVGLFRRHLLQFRSQAFERIGFRAGLITEIMKFLQPQADTKFLEPAVMFVITLRLGRLRLHRAQLLGEFVEQIARSRQILLDIFELSQGLDFASLEATDSGGFLEDQAAILVRGLEQRIDAALLDDAVGALAGAGAEEQVFDVAQPAGLIIDEVFALAVAVDPASDADLIGFDVQEAFCVVADERDLGHAEAAARTGAVENDIGHFAAAKAFGRLLAEDPADRVDDVGLSRAVWADDGGNARRELDRRFVGEALEAYQLESLEHASFRKPEPRNP